MRTKKEKDFEEFVRLMVKLEPAEFCGLMSLLGVRFGSEPPEVADMLNCAFDKFLTIGRHQRREILQMLRATQKKG